MVADEAMEGAYERTTSSLLSRQKGKGNLDPTAKTKQLRSFCSRKTQKQICNIAQRDTQV